MWRKPAAASSIARASAASDSLLGRISARAETRELVLELLSELVLLPRRVQAGEGVLPLPDDDDPGQGEDTERG